VIRQALRSISGTYRLRAGLLVTPSIQQSEGGGFVQSGGTNRAGTIAVQGAGEFGLSGGSLSSSNTSVTSRYGDYTIYSNLRSSYTQSGGSHDVQSLFSSGEGGVAQLQGGWLNAPEISVGPLGGLSLSGAAVTNSGTFTILGGAHISAIGNYQQLGKLIVTPGPPPAGWPPSEWPSRSFATLLSFGSGATTLRFRDSRDVTWDLPLVVTNWSGSPNGNGTHRFHVGTSAQGLTRAQLDLIRFANPAGLLPGTYPAVILATGEVVPGPRPTVSMTRSSSGMRFSWSGNYQLYTSTNVVGPYSPISGATSPYTNSFTDPQHFFFLRSP